MFFVTDMSDEDLLSVIDDLDRQTSYNRTNTWLVQRALAEAQAEAERRGLEL
jgi:hypothetical protein